MNELIESIKRHEGYRGTCYKDSLGIETIGYGSKLPITKIEAELLLKHRLNNMIKELQSYKPFIINLPNNIQEVLYEMAYQLGIGSLLKFKNMWKALENQDIEGMIKEMRNSKWYRQTPNRVEELIKKIKDNKWL